MHLAGNTPMLSNVPEGDRRVTRGDQRHARHQFRSGSRLSGDAGAETAAKLFRLRVNRLRHIKEFLTPDKRRSA